VKRIARIALRYCVPDTGMPSECDANGAQGIEKKGIPGIQSLKTADPSHGDNDKYQDRRN